jgi:5,10-methenyltetrahydrofolate synthetase
MGMTSPEKQDLRLRLKAQLQTCDLTAYVPDAIRTVESCESFKNASVILAYTPINSLEIPFMQALHATHSDKEWFFVDANATEPVFRNSHGVVYVGDFVLVCCLVPSLALDVLGNRLGKGGGFYDRFLYSHHDLRTVSVVPDFAFFDALPVEAHDVRIMNVFSAHTSMSA